MRADVPASISSVAALGPNADGVCFPAMLFSHQRRTTGSTVMRAESSTVIQVMTTRAEWQEGRSLTHQLCVDKLTLASGNRDRNRPGSFQNGRP